VTDKEKEEHRQALETQMDDLQRQIVAVEKKKEEKFTARELLLAVKENLGKKLK